MSTALREVSSKTFVGTVITTGWLALTAIVLPLAGTAYGQSFCVNDSACASSGGTNVSGSSDGEKLQAALDQAAGNGVEDTIFIGPGTYKTSQNGGSGFYYGDDEAVSLIGTEGSSPSDSDNRPVIEIDNPFKYGLRLSAAFGSTQESKSKLSNIAFKLNSESAEGLWLYSGADGDNLLVTVGPSATGDLLGVELNSNPQGYDSTVAKTTVDFTGVNTLSTNPTGISTTCGPIAQGNIDHTVESTTIVGAEVGIYNCAVSVIDSGTGLNNNLTVKGAKIIALQGSKVKGIESSLNSFLYNNATVLVGGKVTFTDSLITADSSTNSPQLLTARARADTVGGTTSIDARRVTLIGNGAFASVGARANSTDSNGGGATITLTDSIIHGTNKSVERVGFNGNGGVANFSANRSFYSDESGKVVESGGGTYTPPNAAYLTDSSFDPGFVDSPGGNFHLKYSSPLVDAGTTPGGNFVICLPFSPYDLSGVCRNIDGKGDGTINHDVGAYEYRRQAPTAKAKASAVSIPPGTEVTFNGSDSSDSDPGEGLIYSWSFSDGTTSQDQSVTKTFTNPGSYTGTITVEDPTGLKDTDSVTVEVVKPAGSESTTGSGTSSTQSAVTADGRPSVSVTRPAKASLKRGKLKLLKGTAKDDEAVVKVELSIVRKARKNGRSVCYSISKTGKMKRYKLAGRTCKPRFLLKARGTKSWSFKLKKALSKGTYTVTAKATDSQKQTATKKIVIKVR